MNHVSHTACLVCIVHFSRMFIQVHVWMFPFFCHTSLFSLSLYPTSLKQKAVLMWAELCWRFLSVKSHVFYCYCSLIACSGVFWLWGGSYLFSTSGKLWYWALFPRGVNLAVENHYITHQSRVRTKLSHCFCINAIIWFIHREVYYVIDIHYKSHLPLRLCLKSEDAA